MVTQTLHKFIFQPDLEKNIFVQNSYLVYSIVLVYIIFVKILGPSIMMKRKPLELRLTIILFNSAIVASNIYLSYTIYRLVKRLWPERCNFKSGPNFHRYYKQFDYICWHLLLVKYAELFDTVFFVLRKKYNQISFLHVFHHSIVCLILTLLLKTKHIGFSMIIIAFINSSVHVLTYSYYGLSAIGPHMKKYLWWKKYLTTIQIVQFITLLIYMAVGFITNCEDFGIMEKTTFVAIVLVMALFLNFYYKAYKVK